MRDADSLLAPARPEAPPPFYKSLPSSVRKKSPHRMQNSMIFTALLFEMAMWGTGQEEANDGPLCREISIRAKLERGQEKTRSP